MYLMDCVRSMLHCGKHQFRRAVESKARREIEELMEHVFDSSETSVAAKSV